MNELAGDAQLQDSEFLLGREGCGEPADGAEAVLDCVAGAPSLDGVDADVKAAGDPRVGAFGALELAADAGCGGGVGVEIEGMSESGVRGVDFALATPLDDFEYLYAAGHPRKRDTIDELPARGTWMFRGTRVPVSALFENLDAGATVEAFLAWFPRVSREQVEDVLRFAQNARGLRIAAPHAGFYAGPLALKTEAAGLLGIQSSVRNRDTFSQRMLNSFGDWH